MERRSNRLTDFLYEDAKKVATECVPVKSTPAERLFVRFLSCDRLYPNPEDEFCDPKIGPNYGIIKDYARQIEVAQKRHSIPLPEPLVVEKIAPLGYMILNGHHRWAAAMLAGLKRVPVQIVNLTGAKDIEEMLSLSFRDKRAVFDLDEVIFTETENCEDPLPFPLSLIYNKRVAKGVPGLFRFLNLQGYDIWVYSSEYNSLDTVKRFLKYYKAPVNGIVTGKNVRRWKKEDRKRLGEKISGKYVKTIHADTSRLILTERQKKDFIEYPLDSPTLLWTESVRRVVESLGEGSD